ncbi:hypothetical protein GJAV_G00166740 [Gymnothorax javanicus]|nr:hypothetical protein GJAV_G00166740 [Gymnothorax javanicus]
MKGGSCCTSALVLTLQAAICAQLLFSLFLDRGEIVREQTVVISPAGRCLLGRSGRAECSHVSGGNTVYEVLVLLSMFSPLPLTLFAALAYLFGVCLDDDHVLRFCLATQALAAVLMFTSIALAIVESWQLIRPSGLTAGFYMSLSAILEMSLVTFF